MVTDSSRLYILNSTFQENTAGIGGAIALRRTSKLFAKDSYFTSNIAVTQTGVISVDQYCTAMIESCHFEDNLSLGSIAVLKSNKADDI